MPLSSSRKDLKKLLVQNLGVWSLFGFGFTLKHLENISKKNNPHNILI